MSVPYTRSSAIDDHALREKTRGIRNPFSNDRVFPKQKATKVEIQEETHEQVIARREAWAKKNLPPLEYLSLAFSTYLIVLMTINTRGMLHTYRTCKLMRNGGLLYITADTFLEVYVLGRYKYIFHHVIALIVFVLIGSAEPLKAYYPIEDVEAYLPVFYWFEISTMLLNVRSLIKEKIFKKTKSTNALAELSVNEAAAESLAAKKIIPTSELLIELFFICTYGGIRLVLGPFLLLRNRSILDPGVILGLMLVFVSGKWVWEWVQSTRVRYSQTVVRPGKKTE